MLWIFNILAAITYYSGAKEGMFGWLRALNIKLLLEHSSHQGHTKFQRRKFQ